MCDSLTLSRTGYGHHADYVFGWEREPFARAMESRGCLSSWPYNCDQLTTQTDEEINECTQRIRVPEVTEGQCMLVVPFYNRTRLTPGARRFGEAPWV